MAGNYEKMLSYYPLLIESAIDFKIESRKILAARNSKYREISLFLFVDEEAVISEDVETCTLAAGYSIVKHNNQFYCLKEG